MDSLSPNKTVSASQPSQEVIGKPPASLTRTQLTAALVLVTLLPFCLVVVLYTTLDTGYDPELEAKVVVGPRAWPSDGDGSAQLVPCATIRNPTSEQWRNVNLSINHQFHFYHPDNVEGGEEIYIPLKFFHTKGNQFFPPESQQLKELTIYAQIPSGARAILELSGEKLTANFVGYP